MLGALGAVAGGVTALSHWWNPVAARNRRLAWNAAHLVLVWPLPVLLILHIVSVYFY
jgi:nitrite reductase (NADH) large subunit